MSSPWPDAATASRRTSVSSRAASRGSGLSSTQRSTHDPGSGWDEELLHERQIIEVGAKRLDLVTTEFRERRTSDMNVAPGGFHRDVVVDGQRAGVVGVESPLGDDLVAAHMRAPNRQADVRQSLVSG